MNSPPAVSVFNVLEHGRRFYRSLVFASNTSCCLASFNSRVAVHAGVPALVGGDALAPVLLAPSLVISRFLADNGGEQTFVPHRFLHGLLPAALLELYIFWQNHSDDSIEGGFQLNHALHTLPRGIAHLEPLCPVPFSQAIRRIACYQSQLYSPQHFILSFVVMAAP